jgi:nucleotide-binding universal stress UspA family protein
VSTIKRILVATDFSEAADAALAYGRGLARTFGATLHVLHVSDDPILRLGGCEVYPVVLPQLQRDLEKRARERLAALLVDNDQHPLPTVPVVITAAATAPTIVDYAARANIDLIVVGTHGQGAVAHFILGSVAERVVRTARCPVLTVPHPERDFITPDVPTTAEA